MYTGSVRVVAYSKATAYYTVPGKKCHFIFDYNSRISLWIFYHFYSIGERNEYSIITCNLLIKWLDEGITVTHQMSRQFNFSLHVKINYIEFGDKFLIKTLENVEDFLSED